MPAGFSPPVRGTRRTDRLPRVEIYDALAAEEAAFDDLLSRLSPADWHRDSACGGWSVADVVLHLAPVSYTHLDVYKRQALVVGREEVHDGSLGGRSSSPRNTGSCADPGHYCAPFVSGVARDQ